jgi:alkylhydroperoxidase/carboxymuconolactone decarboxylase family protein YurZ
MASRFEKFTERARRVLSLSQEEAQRLHHNYIGTEHILLGLARETESVAARVIVGIGVELDQIRTSVEYVIGSGESGPLREIGLTPRAKKVIELAVDEARAMNHNYIGTEHLLIGLIREGEGLASNILTNLGLNLEKVRRETVRILSQPQEQARRGPQPGSSPPITETWQARGYHLEMHGIMAAADPEWTEKYNAFIEATYTGQRLLDRKTKELLQIVVEAALRADVDQIRAHIKVALQEGATPQEILEALETVAIPMGGLAFRRGLQAWAAETGFNLSTPE